MLLLVKDHTSVTLSCPANLTREEDLTPYHSNRNPNREGRLLFLVLDHQNRKMRTVLRRSAKSWLVD